LEGGGKREDNAEDDRMDPDLLEKNSRQQYSRPTGMRSEKRFKKGLRRRNRS